MEKANKPNPIAKMRRIGINMIIEGKIKMRKTKKKKGIVTIKSMDMAAIVAYSNSRE